MILEVDALLFDSDGVLVDSHEETEIAWRRLATEFGLDVDTVLTNMAGIRAEDTLSRHVAPHRLADSIRRLEELEVGSAGETKPIPGAVELLAGLPTDRWTIVTSASRRLADARWAGAGIPIPAHPVTAEDVASGKPDPHPYLTGAVALGFAPARCLVFEDSDAGGRSGAAAGSSVVGVGSQTWSVAPVARVRDLTEVRVSTGRGGGLTVTLDGRHG
jgi:sugar-phosphatase